MSDPQVDLTEARAAHERVLATVIALDDDTARQPSLLPGWDVAMVLTHLARHAESQIWAMAGPAVGELRARYPDGVAGRNADIEAGRGRSAAALLEDLASAITRLEATWDEVPDEQWASAAVLRLPEIDVEPFVILPFQRWREVETHHVDLGLGYSPADWPDALADRWLPEMLEELQGRFDHRALMAWILGRGPAPVLGTWR